MSRFLILLSIVTLFSCVEPLEQEWELKSPTLILPEVSRTLRVTDFPQPERNLMTEEGVILGKKLFFDQKLSANGQVSCATCHQPEIAFTDGEELGDFGVSGNRLKRHSPPLFNLAWNTTGLFWDGGANDLESLNFGPLTHKDEMAADLDDIVAYLSQDKDYPKLFEAAFREIPIQSAYISRAISQYSRTLISQDSKYDQWKKEEVNLTSIELQGYSIYQNNCASCHQEGLFTDLSFHNNGLDLDYPNPPELEGLYQGRYRISYLPKDMGAYKTPSLRNIMITAPYMHDGRFQTIEEVLNHYESGIQVNASLAPSLQNGIKLSTEDRQALISFLNTLTDEKFISKHAIQN
jgi:cytochrome c peroxidase